MQRRVNRTEGSNWGDFGADDQIGRMNLLTPERRLAAGGKSRKGSRSASASRLISRAANSWISERRLSCLDRAATAAVTIT